MFSVNDRILVTGASSGIGKGVTLSLLKEGAFVIATGRNIEKLNQLEKEAANSGNLAIEHKDLSKIEGLDEWVLELAKKYGKLKGLVLSAGILHVLPLLSIKSVEKAKELFDVNFFACLQIAKGFCDRRANVGKGASIVFLSSIASLRGVNSAGILSYSASKSAINAAVRSLALEVSKQGIRVNAVLPGLVETEMLKNLEKNGLKGFRELEKNYPLGIGKVEDVVEPIIFLLSDKARWITGIELIVDGGASL